MRRETEELGLILLCVVFGASSASSAVEPARREPPARRDPSMIDIGWWWYWYAPDLEAKVTRWRSRNKSRVHVRKIFGGASQGATVIVFEVTERFRWTLPGLPERAPRGADTDLSDVAGVIPAPPSALRKMVEQVAKTTWEYLKELYEGRRPPREKFPL